MKRVVVASALLAVCTQGPGAGLACGKMRGGVMSAVSYAELLLLAASHAKQDIARAIVATAEIAVIPFDAQFAVDATGCFEIPTPDDISLADRSSLYLATCESLPLLTGNPRLTELDVGIEFELVQTMVNLSGE